MTPHILKWLRDVSQKISVHSILEVGSFNVNGSPRSIFPGMPYTGVDIAPGPGVDLVIKDEGLLDALEGQQYDLVICCEALEHCKRPLVIADQMRDLVRPGGWMIVTSPGNGWPMHRYPKDYWRLMPDTYTDSIFDGFEIISQESVGERRRGGPRFCSCYLGKKPG